MSPEERSAFTLMLNGFTSLISSQKNLLSAHLDLLGRLANGEQLDAGEITAARLETEGIQTALREGETTIATLRRIAGL
jgi:hypothetical protein